MRRHDMRRISILGAILVAANARADDFARDLGAARVALVSDGKAVSLTVEVKDAHVVSDANPERGDHVEVWLAAVPTPSAVVQEKNGHGLYLIDDKADVKALAREVAHPTIQWCDKRKHSEKETEEDGPPLPAGTLVAGHAFFGMVHLGFFPDGRPTHLYDRELYAKALDLGAADQGASYTATRTADGYRIQATLAPQAFGFLPRGDLRTFRVQVNVFDGDRKPGMTSTAKAPRWGDPDSFDEVKLARPIDSALFPGVTVAAEPWPPIFMWSARGGWEMVERRVDVPANMIAADCTVTAPRISSVGFVVKKLTPGKAQQLGKHSFQPFSIGDDNDDNQVIMVVDGVAVPATMDLGGFTFPDGKAGWLAADRLSEGRLGRCGGVTRETLVLIRFDGGKAIPTELARLDACRHAFEVGGHPPDGIYLANDPDTTFMKMVAWKDKGRSLTITAPTNPGGDEDKHGTARVVVEWDDHGANVRSRLVR